MIEILKVWKSAKSTEINGPRKARVELPGAEHLTKLYPGGRDLPNFENLSWGRMVTLGID